MSLNSPLGKTVVALKLGAGFCTNAVDIVTVMGGDQQ